MRTFTLLAIIASYAAAIKDDGASIAADVATLSSEGAAAGNAAAAGGDAVAAEADKAANNAAIVSTIDDTLNKAPGADDAQQYTPDPDNYRPPPVQDHSRRERRERPNIHDHALLKSMDLSFVSGGFQNQNQNRGSTVSLLGGSLGGLSGGYQQQPVAYAQPQYNQYGQQILAQPQQVYGQPQQVYGQPQQVYGQPQQVYGQP